MMCEPGPSPFDGQFFGGYGHVLRDANFADESLGCRRQSSATLEAQ
jgi:hypothetical protein